MNLHKWLQKNRMQLIEFERISGVPYQRVSQHIQQGKPLAERYVARVLKATNKEVDPVTLRPTLKEILRQL